MANSQQKSERSSKGRRAGSRPRRSQEEPSRNIKGSGEKRRAASQKGPRTQTTREEEGRTKESSREVERRAGGRDGKSVRESRRRDERARGKRRPSSSVTSAHNDQSRDKTTPKRTQGKRIGGGESRQKDARRSSSSTRSKVTVAERRGKGTNKPARQRNKPARQSDRNLNKVDQRNRASKLSSYRRVGVITTGVVLVAASVVGLLFFARPTTSEVEKRTLTPMPAFSWNSFWSGSYFSDLALWYSDTYPLREQLVSADQAISALHGIKSETQMIGGTKQADELPPAGSSSDAKDGASDSEDNASSSTKREREKVEVPAQEVMAEAIQNQVLDGLYVKGDSAYSIYYFSQEAVQEYADAMNEAAKKLKGVAEVYSVIAPNSSGILLSEKEVKDLGGTNQVDAIKYFYSLYSDDVHPVDSVPKLQEHDDEYIFYRTDHHWTSLGAYYAYQAFCEEKGVEAEDRDDMKHVNMGDFLGSYYAQLKSAEMQANPDYVEAWIPNGTNKMRLWDQDGTVSDDYNVITDTSKWDITGKTMGFMMGDQPLQKVENPKVTDGSTCLVIKDSFGDFFAPWLVDHYQTLYVGDFRYFESNIVDFVKENKVTDVVFCNNVTLAGGGVVGPAILGRL